MKFLTVFAAILAVAVGARSHWTLNQLSEALQDPHTNPSLVPILEQALNSFMAAIFAGESHEYISITTAPVDLSTWTLQDLFEALESPNTNPAFTPYLEHALNSLMNAIFAGQVQATTAQVSIVIPALDITYWTLSDLDAALSNPATSANLVPYLEQALNQIVDNLMNGVQQTSVVLATPLEPATPVTPEVVVAPEVDVIDTPLKPVIVANPAPNPVVPSPVATTPVATEAAPVSGSPLVQIILNINQQSVAPEAVITPIPVTVPDNTEALPNPRPPAPEVIPVDEDPFVNPRPPAPVLPVPEPVIVPETVPEPVVVPNPPTPDVEPEPVIVAPDFNPIDVIAVNPEPINPIEVIAVAPPDFNPIDAIAIAPPEINPVDLLNPVLVPVVVAGGDIGPM